MPKMSNKEKGNFSNYLRIAGSLFLIASIMALLLAVFNSLTKDRIAENTQKEIEATINGFFSEYGEVKSELIETEIPDGCSVQSIYNVTTADGAKLGYVAICAPGGFKAAIDLAVGMEPDGKCREVSVISLSETPGVGAKVAEKAFTDGFKGESGELKVSKDGGTIDAVAGATISSRAVTRGVNDALALVQNIIGGEAK